MFKVWMTSIVGDWRIDLIKAYPNLFHPPGAGPEVARGYPACGRGWRGILNSACAKIEAAITEGESFKVVQIKERLGTLRFYWRGNLSTGAETKIVEALPWRKRGPLAAASNAAKRGGCTAPAEC